VNLAGKLGAISYKDCSLLNKELFEILSFMLFLLSNVDVVGIEHLFTEHAADEFDDLFMSIPESLCSAKI